MVTLFSYHRIVSQSTPTMSATASSNKRTVHFGTPNEDGESSGGALEGPFQNNNVSPGNGGVSPVSESSKPPFINSAATSLNEKSEQPAVVKGKQSDERIDNLVDLFREFLEAAPNPATSKSTRAQQNTARRKKKKRVFGLTKSSQPETESNNPYDYEQKYPRDRPFEEVADNARVWLTYLDEAELFDRERVEGWKDTVDVLLVFAGLFSGVISAFVSQASKAYSKIIPNGTPLNNITNSPLTPTSPFTPSTNALLVNGLWFTSLAIALSTALFAVLAKQWLHYYLTSITGTPQEKARARQLRFKGFESWKVGAIVELLPILLYTAVGMFLMGIIILLFPLDARIAWTLAVITGVTYVLYFISVLLPIQYPECPYTTSLTIYIGILVFALRTLRWAGSRNLERVFQAVWRRMDLNARRTIRHLLHNALRFINVRLLYTLEFIHRLFRKLQPAIFADSFLLFADGSPKFTNWREENIKKAIKDADSLDFEALNWLYGSSLNRSVHRIIARCAAVYPGIFRRFDYEIQLNLDRTLEISETNLMDLRYGLCLDLMNHEWDHWRLLRSIPDVEEADTEYRSYSYISKNIIDRNYDQIVKDVNTHHLELPLAMWCVFFERAPLGDTTIAACMLTSLISRMSGLFEWKCNPSTRGSIPNVGVVSFNSEELGWWKFDFLHRYFFYDTEPDYSLDKTFETRYHLLITIYRNLTSDRPLIADKEQRQQSLCFLFSNFSSWLDSKPHVSSEHCQKYLAFFVDVFCANEFWSESMVDRGRYRAVDCLDQISKLMDTDVASQFPFTKCDDLSPIYQWCSRDDLDRILSWYTAPVFTLLFMPQNRTHLCTILSRDPNAASHFANYFRNMSGDCHTSLLEREYIYPNLIDLLKSVNQNVPLFNILYDLSVLVQVWRFLRVQVLDAKTFLLIVKSKLGQKKLNNLYAAMTEEVRSSEGSYYIHQGLKRSVHEFGQMISVSHPQLESATEQFALEHAHVPDANEVFSQAFHSNPSAEEKIYAQRDLHFIIAKWTNQAFRSLWLKIRSGNRDQDVDVELS